MGVEQLLPIFDKKIYDVKNIQLKFVMDKNERGGLNDTQMCMNAALNVMFSQVQASRGFNLFSEIQVEEIVKQLKQLDEDDMPEKKFIE